VHRKFCQAMRQSREGYPDEKLESAYVEKKPSAAFAPPSSEDEDARLTGCGLVFAQVREYVPLVSRHSVIVGEDQFKRTSTR